MRRQTEKTILNSVSLRRASIAAFVSFVCVAATAAQDAALPGVAFKSTPDAAHPGATFQAAANSNKPSVLPPKWPAQVPNASSNVTYMDGQLSINMANATLTEVLNSVSAVLGIQIDMPAETDPHRMPVIKIGPGHPRDVLASLLNGSRFDYLIQSADSEPDKIKTLLLFPAGVKDKTNGNEPAPPPSRYLSARDRAAKPEESAAVGPVVIPVTPAVEQPASPSLDTQVAPPASAIAAPTAPSLMETGPRPGALSPPAEMTPDNITNQLQQMYKQRMQMNQQGQTAPPPSPGKS